MAKQIYTFDTETDPFLYGRIPEVFTCFIYGEGVEQHFWGKDCMAQAAEFIKTLPPGIIYAHNGGRFDFYYMIDWFDGNIMIIASRIVRGYALGHEWRDSAAIYPIPLKSFKKDAIDYDKLERRRRNRYKEEIIKYMRSDCVYLHELVSKFYAEFGNNLTIGGTSMKMLRKMHKFETLSAEDDARIRGRFYYGGRVQCFEKGIIKPYGDALYCFDINQSYPTSMRNYNHPIGTPRFNSGPISKDTYFLSVAGFSHGCFPKRSDDNSLSFPVGRDTFNVTIHEYNAAIETGQFEPEHIIECVDFEQSGNFAEFVDEYHGLRKQAKLNGDTLASDFYKLVCNSAYGKFAQCPDNYYDWIIKPKGEDVEGYDPDFIIDNMVLWRKQSDDVTRYNVATGASITGCSRSFLIRALAYANRPLYCDTDSIICEGLSGDTIIDDTKLGAWKLEKYGDTLALAGRKLYALFKDGEAVKSASKGVRLTPAQIMKVAKGERVTWQKDAPTFSLTGEHKFLQREVRLT